MTVERPSGPVGLGSDSPEVRSGSSPASNGLRDGSGRVDVQNNIDDMPPPQQSAGTPGLDSPSSLLDLVPQETAPVHAVVGSDSQDSTMSSTSDISRVSQLSSENSNGSVFSIPDADALFARPQELVNHAAVDVVKVVGSGSIRGGSSTETTSAEGSPKSDSNPSHSKGPKRTASGAVKRSGVVVSSRAMPIASERRDLRATEVCPFSSFFSHFSEFPVLHVAHSLYFLIFCNMRATELSWNFLLIRQTRHTVTFPSLF
jgi:hypothetical protein